jgi:alpha-tubulin suppressor-like RCC1 family protein
MWGYNGFGQLGVGDTTARYLPVLSATSVSKMYTHPSQDSRNDTYVHYFHQKTDGKVYTTGYNAFGQLGLGNTTNRTSWTEVTGAGTNPIGVYPLGGYTSATVVQKSDGSIWTCGYNQYGQLGINSTTANITSLTNTGTGWNNGDTSMRIQTIGFGGGTSDGTQYEQCTIAMFLDNGSASRIATCGSNNWGQLGDTTTTQRQVPIVPTNINFRVSKMMWSGCSIGQCWILKTDGTLWNWGFNQYGQCSRGDTTTPKSTPAQVTTGVLDLFIHNNGWFNYGYDNASPIVYKADGYYRCGYNGYGQLGDGTVVNKSVLTKMRFPQDTTFKYFGTLGATGNAQQTFIGVDTTNRIWAWGSNVNYGIISVGTATNMPQPVQVSPSSLLR